MFSSVTRACGRYWNDQIRGRPDRRIPAPAKARWALFGDVRSAGVRSLLFRRAFPSSAAPAQAPPPPTEDERPHLTKRLHKKYYVAADPK